MIFAVSQSMQSMRPAIAADFCNGTSLVLDFKKCTCRPHRQFRAASLVIEKR
jgi:hypothetical protein